MAPRLNGHRDEYSSLIIRKKLQDKQTAEDTHKMDCIRNRTALHREHEAHQGKIGYPAKDQALISKVPGRISVKPDCINYRPRDSLKIYI